MALMVGTLLGVVWLRDAPVIGLVPTGLPSFQLALPSAFCQAFVDGDDDKARELDAKLQPIHEALFMETSPIPTKWALNAMGKIDVGIRLPLVELTAPVQAEVRKRLETLGAL